MIVPVVSISAICATRTACRPPSNTPPSQASTIIFARSAPTTRLPIASMLVSLCSRERRAENSSFTFAALYRFRRRQRIFRVIAPLLSVGSIIPEINALFFEQLHHRAFELDSHMVASQRNHRPPPFRFPVFRQPLQNPAASPHTLPPAVHRAGTGRSNP